MSTVEFADSYLADVRSVLDRISRTSLDEVVAALLDGWSRGATIFLAGNGGSAATATHFASDLSQLSEVCPKGKPLRALSLCTNLPLVTSLANDHGFDSIFSSQLDSLMRPADVLLAISVHGGTGAGTAGPWSGNLVRAMREAKAQHQATVIGLCGFDGGVFPEIADICLLVPASSTGYVEGCHLLLEHLIVSALRQELLKEK